MNFTLRVFSRGSCCFLCSFLIILSPDDRRLELLKQSEAEYDALTSELLSQEDKTQFL